MYVCMGVLLLFLVICGLLLDSRWGVLDVGCVGGLVDMVGFCGGVFLFYRFVCGV